MSANPQSTAIARVPEMPDWLSAPLEKYVGNPNFELLLPSVPVNAALPFGHRVSVSIVQINPDPAEKEIFKVGSQKVGDQWEDLYALSKSGVEKLAEGAGVHIDTFRVDDRSNRDYCEFKAIGVMRGSTGQVVRRSASKAFYMPDVEAEAWRSRVKANDNPKTEKYRKTEAQLKEAHDGEMSSFRKHLLARTESGAMLRVVRNMLAIKSGLTRAQIAKPKVMVRIDFAPDATDDASRQFLLDQGSKAMSQAFGPASVPKPTKRHIGDAVVVDDEEDDEETAAARAAVQAPGKPLEQQTLEPDYFALIGEGCMILGLDQASRQALFVQFGGDLKKIHAEVSRLVDARGQS